MGDRPEVAGWRRYAWANHAWETTVSTVLIGPWLLALAKHHRTDRSVLFGIAGVHLRAESYPSFIVTIAALAQLAVLPFIGSAADRRRDHGRLLAAACVGGSVIAVVLAVTSGGEYAVAGAIFVAGSVLYGISDLLYNSFLPRLAAPDARDLLSSRGFAAGYLGGGLLLAANLALLLARHEIGIGKATAVRVCFVSAGLWWAGFGLRAIRRFTATPIGATTAAPTTGGGVVHSIRGMPRQTRRYLSAYLLFSDATTAVIALASTFITHELFGGSATKAATFLFALILLIQAVAIGGSLAFGRLALRVGAKRALLVSLAVWVAVIVYAYAGLHSKAEAVVAGVVIGLVLGGSQALARSLWSQLVPPGREAAFFGLFEVSTKGTSWIAPLLFTIVVNATGSYRQAILSLIVLFVAGGGLLAITDLDTAMAGTGRIAESP